MIISIKNVIKDFIGDRSGVTAIEYALIASLCAMAITGAAAAMSGKLQNTFDTVSGNLTSGQVASSEGMRSGFGTQ